MKEIYYSRLVQYTIMCVFLQIIREYSSFEFAVIVFMALILGEQNHKSYKEE